MSEEKKLLEELVLGLVKENHKLAQANKELKREIETLDFVLKEQEKDRMVESLTVH